MWGINDEHMYHMYTYNNLIFFYILLENAGNGGDLLNCTIDAIVSLFSVSNRITLPFLDSLSIKYNIPSLIAVLGAIIPCCFDCSINASPVLFLIIGVFVNVGHTA